MNPAMAEVAHLSFSSGLVAASSSSSVDDSALSSSSESVTGDLLQKTKALILTLWLLCSGVDGKGYLGTFVHITPVAAMQWCGWQGIFGHICSYYPCGCYAVVWMARDIWARLFILPLWLLCSCVDGKGYLGTFVHITPVAAMQWCEWQGIFGHVCSYYPCGCYAVVWMARDIWARLFILPLWLLCSCVDGKGYLGTFVHAYVGKQLHTHIYICTKHLWIFVHICS